MGSAMVGMQQFLSAALLLWCQFSPCDTAYSGKKATPVWTLQGSHFFLETTNWSCVECSTGCSDCHLHCELFQSNTCSTIVFFTEYREVCPLPWSFPQTAGKYHLHSGFSSWAAGDFVLWYLDHLIPLLLLWPRYSQNYFLLLLSPLPLCAILLS